MDAEGPDHPRPGTLAKNRIEALADGIFAVAMTLLVLDIKLPDGAHFPTDGALIDRMLSLEHTFVIYLISFVVLGMYWTGHHLYFHFVRYVDHTLLWINLAFLFGVTSVPFATDLLGDHHDLMIPYILYGTLLLLLAVLLLAQLAYLRHRPDLASFDFDRGAQHRIMSRLALFSVIPLLSMAAVFYNTRLAMYLYFLLPIVHFLPGRVDQAKPPEPTAPQDEQRDP